MLSSLASPVACEFTQTGIIAPMRPLLILPTLLLCAPALAG